MSSLAELLRELKGRSGLSYGVLAKRLHMSTSTLHRYCNGDAVPVEFAPVERFARLCKASPEELVEVHRRWILADAARGRKAGPAEGRAGAVAEPPRTQQPQPEKESEPEPHPEPEPQSEPEPRPESDSTSAIRPEPMPGRAKRRRAVAIGAAVALVVGAGSLALALNGADDGGDGRERAAGVSSSAAPHDSPGGPSGKGGREDTDDGRGKKKGEPTSSPSDKDGKGGRGKDGPARPDTSQDTGRGPAAAGEGRSGDLGAPITARTRPYVYESPCSQRFLVNRKPNQVPQPPAVEQDAPGWAADLGAVSAGEQLVEVTVQGLGKDTVVLQGMHVRVQSTSSPLAWNDFQMGVGCGGNVSTKSFAVDLDDGTPTLTPKAGQRDFPYKVSESDPEVFYVKASTEAHDVRWYLELEWSSGRRHNVLRIDDQGKPFRTSGNEGRPTYGWPLGGSKWEAPLNS
ncbi:helix-turn-helix domain-containing protein [Streptomyces huasconensis]|uniref:helix-turn-helix domain-containing protein n=1 Tax=Streptomyces huasconensis TaxID=1854574 RepID=UPI0036F5A3CF